MVSKVITKNDAVNKPQVKEKISSDSFFEKSLSIHKIAVISEININDDRTITNVGNEVKVLFVEGDKTVESQWQTPFENSNPEHKLPTLVAGLQSGQTIQAISGVIANNSGMSKDASNVIGSTVSNISDVIDPIAGKLKETIESLKGRTNVTKVNSEQIYLSTSSIQLNLTVFVMAISDAKNEVEAKIAQLEKFALPKHLSDDAILVNVANNGLSGLFPSTIPPFVSLTISGKTYAPFIIQSVSAPLSGPIDKDGNRLSAQLTLSLISRTAWDSSDIDKLYGIK